MERTGKMEKIMEEHGKFQVVQAKDGYRLFVNGKALYGKPFDEITFDFMNQSFICRKKRDYDFHPVSPDRDGSSYTTSIGDEEYDEDGRFCNYCVNGKFGCRYDGKEILPPIYDDIHKWDRCDVIYTRIGMDIRYFDMHGCEILKKRRAVGSGKDHLEPYYDSEPQHTDIVQTIDCTESPQGDDFCVCYGHRAGLRRQTRSEHMAWIRENASSACRLFRKITLFAPDCYIYSAYMAQSGNGAKHPVDDCLRQLEEFGAFYSSWNTILTILVPRRGCHRRITKQEIKAIRAMQHRTTDRSWTVPAYKKKQNRIACNRFDYITIDAVFKGTTDRIESGAIVLATICFADHWPSREEYAEWERKTKRREKKRRGRKAKKKPYYSKHSPRCHEE